MNENVILQTDFPKLNLVNRGKVRDIYDVGEHYLIVSTDRISAYDVIMNEGIPFKGKVLTKISEFWFSFTETIIENHLISTNVDQFPAVCSPYKDELRDRSMLVKKVKIVPIESVVRGYLSGSGWNDYLNTGQVCGIKLPGGLQESEKLDRPIFTPATKEELGMHDQNISEQEAAKTAGSEKINFIKTKTIEIYNAACEFASSKGIIIADTKMEFGIYNNRIIIADELLTPDSSRFWPADQYMKGRGQVSYDKQFVRDYLNSVNFNRKPPPPALPDDVIHQTSEKYLDVLYKLTGINLV